MSFETYTTGTGQKLYDVHPMTSQCIEYGCVIHCPSKHSMKDFPTHWRHDRRIMERICPHGVGHPDPDDAAYRLRVNTNTDNSHGCCGCCGSSPQKEKDVLEQSDKSN